MKCHKLYDIKLVKSWNSCRNSSETALTSVAALKEIIKRRAVAGSCQFIVRCALVETVAVALGGLNCKRHCVVTRWGMSVRCGGALAPCRNGPTTATHTTTCPSVIVNIISIDAVVAKWAGVQVTFLLQ